MEPLTEIEAVTVRLSEAEHQHAALLSRINRLKAQGSSTALLEQLLHAYETTLQTMQAHLRQLTTHVGCYRCYWLNGDHIRGVQMLEATDDAEVLVRVGHLLKNHLECPNKEVWQGKRLVAHLARS